MRCVSKLILAFVFAGSSVFATDSMSLLCESSLGNIFWNQEGGKIIKKDSEEREIVCGRGFNKPTQAVAHSSKDIVVFKTKSGSFWCIQGSKIKEIGYGFSAGKMKFIGDKLWFANVRGELWKKDFAVDQSKFTCVVKMLPTASAVALLASGYYLLAGGQTEQGSNFFDINYQPWSQCLVDSDQCSSYEAEVFTTMLPVLSSSTPISGIFKVATAGSVMAGCVPCAVASGAAAFVSSYFQ